MIPSNIASPSAGTPLSTTSEDVRSPTAEVPPPDVEFEPSGQTRYRGKPIANPQRNNLPWAWISALGLVLAGAVAFFALPPGAQVFHRVLVNTWPPAQVAHIYDLMTGIEQGQVLNVGIRLGVFDALEEEPLTAREVALRVGIHPRSAEVLLTYLSTLDLLHGPSFDHRYSLSRLSRKHLLSSSDSRLAEFAHVWSNDAYVKAMNTNQLLDSLRNGGRDGNAAVDVQLNHPFWAELANHTYFSHARVGHDIAKEVRSEMGGASAIRGLKVLDLGCGNGAIGYEIAKLDASIRVTCVDQASLMDVAHHYSHVANVAKQVAFVPGNLFTSNIPGGFDVVVVSNILQNFDQNQGLQVLQKASRALKSNGLLIVNEFLKPEETWNPWLNPVPYRMDLTMTALTSRGRVITTEEMKQLIRNSGFHSLHTKTNWPQPNTFVFGRKV